jgi:hypothetical protein
MAKFSTPQICVHPEAPSSASVNAAPTSNAFILSATSAAIAAVNL